MINKVEAISSGLFHFGNCSRTIGKRGGITINIEQWKRNGNTQTWKTRPDNFRVPIKMGLYNYGSIENWNAEHFHTWENCPLKEREVN